MSLPMELPPQLLKAIDEDRCVFFFGAGVSLNAGLPSGRALAATLERELREDMQHDTELRGKLSELDQYGSNLPEIAQLYDDYYRGRRAYQTVVTQINAAEQTAKTEFLRPLMNLPTIREIITTNFDSLLERFFPAPDCQTIYRESDIRRSLPQKLKIIKLHGTCSDVTSMVLTRSDYQQFFDKNTGIIELVKTLLRQKMLVVVGYALEDANFGTIYDQTHSGEHVLDYFVSPEKSLFQQVHWAHKLQHIAMTAAQFFEALSAAYEKRHYVEEGASFSHRSAPEAVEPLNNPFVLYDTEALIEEKPRFLFETFVTPVHFPLILEHRHTIIEGHRGSGKSTILWRLSLKSRIFDKSTDLPMWGFYVKMVPGLFTAFRRPTRPDGGWATSNDLWLRSFTHYFNLILFTGVLLNLEDAIKGELFHPAPNLSDGLKDIASRLLRMDSADVNSLSHLRRRVEDATDTLLNTQGDVGFYTGPTFLVRALDALSDFIPGLRDKWWHILLDEYDNVYPEQQAVVNVLLRERHSKLRFKIAVKTLYVYLLDINGRAVEPTDDFGYLACDSFIWDQNLKQEYIKFLETISDRRLQQSGNAGYSIRTLLPAADQSDERQNQTYAGFETYCMLSSGLTRLYLELCKDAVYEAFPSTAFKKVDLQPIPIRIQHHVAKIHSAILFKSYRSTPEPQRVLRLFRVLGPLFRAIVKVTADQKEYRSPLSFDIVDLDQVSKESADVLENAIKCRLLQYPIIPKRPHNPMKDGPAQKYSFHRLLTPIFGLPLSERYTIPLNAAALNRIWTQPADVLEELAKGYRDKGILKHLRSILPLFEDRNDDD